MQHPQNLTGPLKTVIDTIDGSTSERAIEAPKLISLKQAASVFRVGIEDVAEMARQGELDTRDLAGTPYITWKSLKVASGIE